MGSAKKYDLLRSDMRYTLRYELYLGISVWEKLTTVYL